MNESGGVRAPAGALALTTGARLSSPHGPARLKATKNEEISMNQDLFENHKIRRLSRKGQPWWVAKDVCAALEIANSRDALSTIPSSHKGVAKADTNLRVGKADTKKAVRSFAIVDEAGLWRLVLKSRTEAAERFTEWLTSEVIPSIRRTGSYDIRDRRRREQLTESRNEMTDCWKEHGCDKPHHYINLTNRQYKHALGATASVIRKERGLEKGANVRQSLSKDEQDSLLLLEVASRMRTRAQLADGYQECADAVDAAVPVLEHARHVAHRLEARA